MARVPLSDVERAELVRILSHAPGVMDKWLALDAELMNAGRLTPRLGEDDRKESLAVAFAELYQDDVSSISDGHFEALYEDFTVEEVVELCSLIAIKEAGIRLGHLWRIAPATDDIKEAYAAVVAEAQEQWTGADSDGTSSLWQRQSAVQS